MLSDCVGWTALGEIGVWFKLDKSIPNLGAGLVGSGAEIDAGSKHGSVVGKVVVIEARTSVAEVPGCGAVALCVCKLHLKEAAEPALVGWLDIRGAELLLDRFDLGFEFSNFVGEGGFGATGGKGVFQQLLFESFALLDQVLLTKTRGGDKPEEDQSGRFEHP